MKEQKRWLEKIFFSSLKRVVEKDELACSCVDIAFFSANGTEGRNVHSHALLSVDQRPSFTGRPLDPAWKAASLKLESQSSKRQSGFLCLMLLEKIFFSSLKRVVEKDELACSCVDVAFFSANGTEGRNVHSHALLSVGRQRHTMSTLLFTNFSQQTLRNLKHSSTLFRGIDHCWCLTDFPNSSKIISRMEMKKKTRPLAAGIEPTSF